MTQSTVEVGQELVIRIVAPDEYLTANDSDHRGRTARLRKAWRNAARLAAVAAHLPKGVGQVRIDLSFHFRGRAPVRDTGNLHPTAKAIVDGLGPQRTWTDKKTGRLLTAPGYGLVVDDSDKHLDGPHLKIGKPLPRMAFAARGDVIVTITVVQP